MTNEDFTPTGSFDSDYSAICTALNYSQMPILLKKPDSLNYKFTPHVSKTMINEDDDDEVKISVSGWKLFPGTIHAFSLCLTACPLITHLSLRNCNLDSPQFQIIVSFLSLSFITNLIVDDNPLISEVLYQGVLNEESNLKFFSTRCNYISDIGAKAMAMSLKTNKSLVHLNLWNNKISRDGCDALADALKINSTLCSLSLGKNPIGDDGAALLIKALSATQVANEELASRKRILEMKKEDEDASTKKAKSAKNAPVAAKKGASPKKEEDPKAKKGAKTAEKPKEGKKVEASNPKTLKKTANTGSITALDKTKKVDLAKSARGKKTKEDLKEEVEVEEVAAIEPMFESNGQWFIIGNRSINNLNLSGCNLTENSLKIINELVMELESTTDATPDGCLGLIRVSLQDNQFQASHPLYQKIEASLLALNPFIEKS